MQTFDNGDKKDASNKLNGDNEARGDRVTELKKIDYVKELSRQIIR